MENMIQQLINDVQNNREDSNKWFAHVEILYIGKANAIYMTPARVYFDKDGILKLSNYAACGLVNTQDLYRRLTRLDSDINKIEMEIYKDDYDNQILLYKDECKSFFRMASDTLILTNIDINKYTKNIFVNYIIDLLKGNEPGEINYSDLFNTKISARVKK